MKEKVCRVETLTPEQAGKIIGKNEKKEGGNWNYNIIKSKFYKYAGINERKYYTKNATYHTK